MTDVNMSHRPWLKTILSTLFKLAKEQLKVIPARDQGMLQENAVLVIAVQSLKSVTPSFQFKELYQWPTS